MGQLRVWPAKVGDRNGRARAGRARPEGRRGVGPSVAGDQSLASRDGDDEGVDDGDGKGAPSVDGGGAAVAVTARSDSRHSFRRAAASAGVRSGWYAGGWAEVPVGPP